MQHECFKLFVQNTIRLKFANVLYAFCMSFSGRVLSPTQKFLNTRRITRLLVQKFSIKFLSWVLSHALWYQQICLVCVHCLDLHSFPHIERWNFHFKCHVPPVVIVLREHKMHSYKKCILSSAPELSRLDDTQHILFEIR